MTSSPTALVTGASGYLASWIVRYLLEAGWTVHATVRSIAQTEKTAHLTELAAPFPGKLRFFEADLLRPGSFAAAMEGCQVVFHTASPFLTGKVKDPEAQLITPAVAGTRNVLETVDATLSVQRVVLTSSVAAIYADATDLTMTENGVFTEAYWNQTASLSYQPYSYSKTRAEQAAWEIAQAQNRWDLVVINPSFILGPSLTHRNDSASIDFMIKMGDGAYGIGMPEMELGIVDVRDVAQAHMAAATMSEASGRHIVTSETVGMLRIGQILREHFGSRYPFPSRKVPKWLVWLVGPLLGIDRAYVKRHVGNRMQFDNSYGIQDLGISYRPIAETLAQHFQQVLDSGLVKTR